MSTGIKESGVRKSRRSFSMLELDMMDIPCESFPYIVEPYKADHWDLTDEALGLRILTVENCFSTETAILVVGCYKIKSFRNNKYASWMSLSFNLLSKGQGILRN